jgi:hypothetical protein
MAGMQGREAVIHTEREGTAAPQEVEQEPDNDNERETKRKSRAKTARKQGLKGESKRAMDEMKERAGGISCRGRKADAEVRFGVQCTAVLTQRAAWGCACLLGWRNPCGAALCPLF